SGLSVVMQALSFLATAKVPGTIFLLGRFLQAVFACTLTYILFPLFAPRFFQAAAALTAAAPSFTATLTGATILCLTANLSLGALALVVGLSSHRKGYRQRYH
ncbi:MAG: hypothetical protein AB1374_03580, partial [Bacillota bacterium]